MADWWDDLGDDELYVRLVQRGVGLVDARHLADHRDHTATRDRIEELIG